MYPDMITKNNITSMLKNLMKYRKLSTREIADLILFMADTSHRQWDIESLLNGINEADDSINWRGIYEKFIEEDLKIWTNIGPIFISYMHSKLILKTSDGNLDSNSDEVVQNQYIPMVKQEDSSSIKLKTDAEIFPFNKSIAATICKILESKEIDPHLFNLFNQFKR
jgi:hypothetical protein